MRNGTAMLGNGNEGLGEVKRRNATARHSNAKIGNDNAMRCWEQQRQSGEHHSKGNAQRSKEMQWRGIDTLGSAAV